MWMHPVWTNFILFQSSDSAAMFPGRYPTVPDNMWTFWNPQAMGLQGQFCGGDLMNQQSQAQSQAQTQANWPLSESKTTSWINNWDYKLRPISSTFNSFYHSIIPRSIHIHLSLQLQCLTHQHQWHLSPHHRDPVHPSMQKRWCNRWRTRLSPVCKRLWTKPKSATWTNLLLLPNHQFKLLHLFQVILLHRMKFHHSHNNLTVALDLAPIDTVGHRTNVQSLFHEVLVVPHHRNEHIVPLDQGRHIEDDILLKTSK